MTSALAFQARGRQALGATNGVAANDPWLQARLCDALIARERSFAGQQLDNALWAFALHAFCLIEGRLPTVRGAPGMQIYGDTEMQAGRRNG